VFGKANSKFVEVVEKAFADFVTGDRKTTGSQDDLLCQVEEKVRHRASLRWISIIELVPEQSASRQEHVSQCKVR